RTIDAGVTGGKIGTSLVGMGERQGARAADSNESQKPRSQVSNRCAWEVARADLVDMKMLAATPKMKNTPTLGTEPRSMSHISAATKPKNMPRMRVTIMVFLLVQFGGCAR